MAGEGKKKAITKEDDSENWCFVCKDGGDLRICDYRQCLKSYHPECVGKKDSFLESEREWDCPWHQCSRCGKFSYLRCYMCTNATCRRCLPAEEILRVKGMYGFCKDCLKLALLIEEKRDCDSDGDHVDFTDRETEEGLFMEYYTIIKNNEGFELKDIYAAKESATVKKNDQPESGSEDFDQEKDSDTKDKKRKRQKSRKRSNGQKSGRPYKKEFIGWASRSLIEFLSSIGKSTTEKLSLDDVTAIVHDYVKKNKLLHPQKRQIIMCDVQLQSLFGKSNIKRWSVEDRLEEHFAEDQNELKEDKEGYVSETRNTVGTINVCKRQRKVDVEKKTQEKEAENDVVPIESRFASIVVENVKLVYLKRSVLKEMLKEPESFEEKATGCFVLFRPNKRYRLIQVKGVKTLSTDETETVLLLSAEPTEIQISLLSDVDFREDEFDVLRGKFLAGEIERPTVGYLQQKARSLHKDMITVRIRKEMYNLPHLINRAYDNGWRYLLPEYWERKKALESGTEYARLLQDVPTVIPDMSEPPTDCNNSGGVKNCRKGDGGCPESTPMRDSVLRDEHENINKSEENAQNGLHTSPSKKREQLTAENPASAEPQEGRTPESKGKRIDSIDVTSKGEGESDASPPAPTGANSENEMWCLKGPAGERNKSPLCVMRRWSQCSSYASKFMVWKEDWREEDAIPLPEALSNTSSKR